MIFEKKSYKMYVLIYSTTFSEIYLIIGKKNERQVIKNVFWSARKVHFILIRF